MPHMWVITEASGDASLWGSSLRSPPEGELVHGVEVGEGFVLVFQQGGKDVGRVRLLRGLDELRDLRQGEAVEPAGGGDVVLFDPCFPMCEPLSPSHRRPDFSFL